MSLLSRSDLLELKYQALQQIAKREGIRANSKKGDIVDLLIKKYPEGVQRHQLSSHKNVISKGETSHSSRPPKRRKISSSPEANESVQDCIQSVPTQPHSATSPALRASPGRLSVPNSPRSPIIGSLPYVYCFKGARRVRRELVKLVNGTSMIRGEVDETEALLKYATKVYDEAALEVDDFSCLRRGVQVIYGFMKSNSTILDGTYLMESPHKEAWKAYAAEQDRLREYELEELDERLRQEYLESTEALLKAGEQDETASNQDLPVRLKRKYSEDIDEDGDGDLEYV